MTLEWFIFIICALVAVLSAILVTVQRNPVSSVLYLVLAFVAQAILYIQLSAIFVAVLQIVVYAGAIMVLFLFVIMLLNLRRDEFGVEKKRWHRWLPRLFAALLAAQLVVVIVRGFSAAARLPAAAPGFGNVEQVATAVFTRYLLPFELTSVLLIVAIVGAVALAKDKRGE